MKYFILPFVLALASIGSYAQQSTFPFGKITYSELEMKSYAKDTSAVAVVLNELGETYISNNDDNDLVLEYHVKIKILRKDGFTKANFSIPLYKSKEGKEERWVSLQASTFNEVDHKIKETKFDPADFFLENFSERFNKAKFTLPDVHEGSVIEIKYVLTSPFIFNWHTWEFQSDIPKIRSEYHAKIPGNYIYNMTLRGFYKLTMNEAEIVTDCFTPGGGMKAECAFYKYAIDDVPAFKEEKYMTAKSNFISSVNFELAEVKGFDGVKKKYTEEWKDVEARLREESTFGGQIKKARHMLDDKVLPLVSTETDSLKKAKIVYDYIRNWYTWNENYSKYSELEIKRAFESHKGNVADINLSLIGALQSAGVNAYPVILSTRDNGLPVQLHPVMSDFNYVVAYIKMAGKVYLLDATDKFTPFGVLPIRCLNDKGRLISRKEADWVELKPKEKQKRMVSLDLKLDEKGVMMGSLKISSYGYEAIDKREEYSANGNKQNYFKELQKKYADAELTNYTIENIDDETKPVIEDMNIVIPNEDSSDAGIFYFDPFLFEKWENNPFKSDERLYPVDLGAPMEYTFLLTMQLPNNLKVDEAPTSLAISLPQNGGRCIINATAQEDKIALSSLLVLNKALYTSSEYHYLKEFFARIIQAQQQQFVLKKK